MIFHHITGPIHAIFSSSGVSPLMYFFYLWSATRRYHARLDDVHIGPSLKLAIFFHGRFHQTRLNQELLRVIDQVQIRPRKLGQVHVYCTQIPSPQIQRTTSLITIQSRQYSRTDTRTPGDYRRWGSLESREYKSHEARGGNPAHSNFHPRFHQGRQRHEACLSAMTLTGSCLCGGITYTVESRYIDMVRSNIGANAISSS